MLLHKGLAGAFVKHDHVALYKSGVLSSYAAKLDKGLLRSQCSRQAHGCKGGPVRGCLAQSARGYRLSYSRHSAVVRKMALTLVLGACEQGGGGQLYIGVSMTVCVCTYVYVCVRTCVCVCVTRERD